MTPDHVGYTGNCMFFGGGLRLRSIFLLILSILTVGAACAAPMPTELTFANTGTLVAGQATQLSAKLVAGDGPVADQAIEFSVGDWTDLALTDAIGIARVVYTPEEAGEPEAKATFAGTDQYAEVQATTTLKVVVPPPGVISLRLEPEEVASGQSVRVSLTGDAGQDCTAIARFTISPGAGGRWDGNTYTAHKAGRWNVFATHGAVSTKATLTVRPGRANAVEIEPTEAMCGEGQLMVYTVRCTDEAGNTWEPTLHAEAWQATIGDQPANGRFDDANGYTPDLKDKAKTVTIRCTVDGVESPPVRLQVFRRSGLGLILAWDKDTKKFHLCNNPTNPSTGRALEFGENKVGPTTVSVSGSRTSLSATITTVAAPPNSLRVRWAMRGDELLSVQQTSDIKGQQRTTTYSRGRTTSDTGIQDGFWGLIHRLDTPSARTISCASAQQP